MKANENNQKVSAVIEEFLWHCEFEKKLSEKTLNAYKADLSQFVSSIGDLDISEVTKDVLRKYLQAISHFRHKTIKRKIATIKAMLNYYEYENEWYNSPMRKMKIRMREPLRLPTVMNIKEVKLILGIVYKQRMDCKSDTFSYQMATRNIAIVELLFASGMRVSELCDLRVCDIDMKQGCVRIIGKGNKERIIDISQKATLSAIKDWLNERGCCDSQSPLFVSRLHNILSTQSVRLLIKNIVASSQIEKKITPHTFRHTYATLLLEEGVDITYIQHLLGHSSVITTQIYTHVNLQKQHEILSKKHPRRLI